MTAARMLCHGPIVLSPPVLQYACSMAKTSVSIPDWMIDEIFRRRQKGENRSEWIRAAIQARFDAEDVGDWVEPELEPPTDATVEADD